VPGGHHARKDRPGRRSDRNAVQRDFGGDAFGRLVDETAVVALAGIDSHHLRRTAYGIVTDLVEAGYLIKQRDGHERTIGEVLELLAARHVSSDESNDPGPIDTSQAP
jgi:hypothetical protein